MAAMVTNILALTRSKEIKNAISSLLMERRDIALETEVGALKSINGAFHERLGQADILLVDLDVDDQEELIQLRQIIAERRGQTSVVATAKKLSTQGVRELIRQGIDDFLPQPLEAHSLMDAIEVVRRKRYQNRKGRSGGKVITVGRAKGGMGATTLATHLALSLIQPTKQTKPDKVCLIDLDLQFGDAGLYLDLDPRSDMVEIVHNPARLDAALLLSAMVEHKSGLEVLMAPFEPMPLDALRVETAGRLIDLAQQEFDYVVIDLPLALAPWHEIVLGMTDKLFLVTQMNVPAIRQTRRMIDVLKDEGLFSLPLSVVLNRRVRRWNDQGRLRQCIKALDHGIDYYLPSDERRALEAINQGISLFEVKKRTRLCRNLQRMALDCQRELSKQENDLARPAELN